MIKKYLVLLILAIGTLFAQPQMHTLSINPGPLLNGPGAIFYLEDTTSPGADSVSWKAPFSLDSSANYIWPTAGGFDNQPFCTDSTNQTSWCTNVTIPNDTKYFIQDTVGTPVGMIWLDSSNLAWIGTLNSPISGGDVVLAWNGVGVAKLIKSDSGNYVLGPDTDITNTATINTIGDRLALWETGWMGNLKLGRPVTSGTGIVAGHFEMYSGVAPSQIGFIMRGALRGIPGLPSASVTGNFVPETTNTWELGDDINNLLWKKISTVDLRVDGTCIGCSEFSGTEGSIPFADSSGSLIEDNANLFYDDVTNDLIISSLGVGGIASDGVGIDITRDGGPTALEIIVYSDTVSFFPQIVLSKPRGSLATPTATQTNDSLGRLSFRGWDTGLSFGGFIEAFADAEWGTAGDSTDAPTRIIFSTSPDGSGTLSERIRIDSSGNTIFNTNITVGVDSTYSLFSAAVRPTVIYSDIISGRTIEIGPNIGTGAKEFEFNVSTVNFLRLDNSTGSAMFKLDSRVANDFQFIINTNRTRMFAPDANFTLDLEMFAGDAVDDLVRIRLLTSTGLNGWNIVFDQTGTANSFIIQDESGVDYFTISQDISTHSFLQPIANQLHTIFFGAGDNVDDDVRVLWQNLDASNGFALLWDQSVDSFIIESHSGSDLITILDTGAVTFAGNVTMATGTNMTSIAMTSLIEINGTGLDYFIDRSAAEGLIFGRTGGDDIIEIEEISSTLNEVRFQSGSGASDDILVRLVNDTAANGYQFLWDQSADLFIIEDHTGTDLFTLNGSGDITVNSCTGCGGGSSLPVVDTISIVKGSVDDTKELRFEVDGLQTGTVTVVTIQATNQTLAALNIANIFTQTQTFDSISFDQTMQGAGQFSMDIRPIGSKSIGISGDVWLKGWFTDLDTVGLDFSGTILGSGVVNMNWNPSSDSARDLGNTTTATWRNFNIENVQVWTTGEKLRIELNNTIASFTQIRINNDAGTRRVNLGISANDAALSLLASSAGRNVALSTITGFEGLTVGGDRVVGFQCSALAVDASDLPTAITLINELKDCINENNHGLAAGT